MEGDCGAETSSGPPAKGGGEVSPGSAFESHVLMPGCKLPPSPGMVLLPWVARRGSNPKSDVVVGEAVY